MELLLHYIWKHKILPLGGLVTTDGEEVEVLSPGLHNHDAGPDFSGAKVRIGNTVWAGDVEIHVRTSDWFRHHHETDPAYGNIILHVASVIDCELSYPTGERVPQVRLEVPEYVRKNYDTLIKAEVFPKCARILGNFSRIYMRGWLTALEIERLEMRTGQIMERRELLDKNWEDTLFVTLARCFGFGKNGDAFERWAYSIPMGAVAKHRDNLFQIEAIFFGQAGLLEENNGDEYYLKLRREYAYLRQKFTLKPMESKIWKFLRLRPQNFPHVRIAQLAMLYYRQEIGLARVISATENTEEAGERLKELLAVPASEYWNEHYSFSKETQRKTEKKLSAASVELVTINGITPVLFAYGRYKDDEKLCERAMDMLEAIPSENNRYIRAWKSAGMAVENAADSQALMQLSKSYCERNDCLRCRFGKEYIKSTPTWLNEDECDG